MRDPNGAAVHEATARHVHWLQVLKTITSMIHPGLKDELAL